MNNNRILGQRAESTIKILEEFSGKQTGDSTIVKSASETTEITKEDLLSAISESNKLNINGMSKRASVIKIDENFNKTASKEFIKSASSYLVNKCNSFGSKSAQVEASEVELTEVGKKGLWKAIPNVKSASVEFKITNTDLGRDNYATVKVAMVDTKFADPECVILNGKTKFAFTSEGWSEMVKACHISNIPQEDSSRHFIIMEYKEYPNIGVKGAYKSLGRYTNYLQLKSALKQADCCVVDRRDNLDFGHAYEVLPYDDMSMAKLAELIESNGIKESNAVRLTEVDQIIPKNSIISFADAETGDTVYIKVSEVRSRLNAPLKKSAAEEVVEDEDDYAAPEEPEAGSPEQEAAEAESTEKNYKQRMGDYKKKAFVAGIYGTDYTKVASGEGDYSSAILINLANKQPFFIEYLTTKQASDIEGLGDPELSEGSDVEEEADGTDVTTKMKSAEVQGVSEGTNKPPTKQDGRKSISGPGGKQKQDMKGKSPAEGSHETDPAWNGGKMENANPESGAAGMFSQGKNDAPTKQDGKKELAGPDGTQKQESPNTGGTEKAEGTGTPDEMLSRGLNKGKLTPAPKQSPGLNAIQKKVANDCSKAKDVKDATPGLSRNLDRMKNEDEDDNVKVANARQDAIKAYQLKKRQNQQAAPAVGVTGGMPPAPKQANSLNKGTDIDDARGIMDKEQTTVIAILKSFKTLDEATNEMNDKMGSDVKTYVRSDVAKIIRNVIRGGYKLVKEDETGLGVNYDIADNSEPIKIVGVDRQKDVPENVNEKKK